MKGSGERRGSGGDYTSEHPSVEGRKLVEIGVTYKQSHEWQKLAAVDDDKFNAAFADGGKPSLAEITGANDERRETSSGAPAAIIPFTERRRQIIWEQKWAEYCKRTSEQWAALEAIATRGATEQVLVSRVLISRLELAVTSGIEPLGRLHTRLIDTGADGDLIDDIDCQIGRMTAALPETLAGTKPPTNEPPIGKPKGR
jgi:hypothetical protein